jgi:hypothetical protein
VPASRDPVETLRAALAELAAADAAELVAEARVVARARARALIEDALVDEVLRAAAQPGVARSQPPVAPRDPRAAAAPKRAASGDACWLYCVLDAVEAGKLPEDVAGIEPGTTVECLCEGDLAALVSRVPLEEYEDERLREHLNDIEWVERTARAHEAVLQIALSAATIVPLRLCTLYREADGVRRLLRADHHELRRNLAAVDGRVECGVQLFADRGRVLAAVRAEPGEEHTPAEGEGTGYLARKHRDRALRAEADELAARCAEDVHHRMEATAAAARANPLQRPEAHARDADMVLNGVYLVERARVRELDRVVEELRGEWEHAGFQLELTGPWPPYNFVSISAPVTP